MNIESFRNETETNKEWRLRRKFLEVNKNKFAVDRLICLSMCYINHVSYGVQYPAAVMKLINELSEGLPRHIDIVKEANFIGFVKSDDKPQPTAKPAEVSSCNYSNFVKANDDTQNNNTGSTHTKRKYGNFVQSTETEKPSLTSEPAAKYSRLVNPTSTSESNESNVNTLMTNKYLNLVKFHKEGGTVSNSNKTSPKRLKLNNVKTKGRQVNNSVVKAETSNETVVNDTESAKNVLTDLEMKFYSLSHNLRSIKKALPSANSIQLVHVAADKTKMTIKCDISPCLANTGTLFVCKICINETHIINGTGTNKRAAKHEAYNRAVNVLSMTCLKINTLENGSNILVGSSSSSQSVVSLLNQKEGTLKNSPKSRTTKRNQNASQNAANKQISKQPINDWIEFLIMSNTMINNATAILRRSANFNKMPIEYVYRPDLNGPCCSILLNEESIMECVGESKAKAKAAVSKKALEWLQERCWTILIKQTADSDDVSLSRDELMSEIQRKQPQAIPSDNVGNQLLRKMGWVGGGIGAEGNKGIENPITVDQVIDRQGLGCRSGVSAQFDSSIHDVLVNYVKSKNQNDLVFATNFSKQERAIMHKEARKLNLKSVSRGTGASRYLVISRKRNPCQLFNHIMESGGSTTKYELIPPKKLLKDK